MYFKIDIHVTIKKSLNKNFKTKNSMKTVSNTINPSLKKKKYLQRYFEKKASSNWSTSSCLSSDPQFKGYKIPKLPNIPKRYIFYVTKQNIFIAEKCIQEE